MKKSVILLVVLAASVLLLSAPLHHVPRASAQAELATRLPYRHAGIYNFTCNEWYNFTTDLDVYSLEVANIDGGYVSEILIGTNMTEFDNKSMVIALKFDYQLWNTTLNGIGGAYDIKVADLDPTNPGLEAVVIQGSVLAGEYVDGLYVTILNASNGAILREANVTPSGGHPETMEIADFDPSRPGLEIAIVRTWTQAPLIMVLDKDLNVIWSTTDTSFQYLYHLEAWDYTGDGVPELIAGGWDGIVVWDIVSNAKVLEYYSDIGLPGSGRYGTLDTAIRLADVNDDGEKEIIFGTAYGYVGCLSIDGTLLWNSTERVGTSKFQGILSIEIAEAVKN